MEREVSAGITGLNLLLVAFICLKLAGTITWSWWWVLAPLWAPLTFVAIIWIGVWIFMARTGLPRT